MFCPSPDRRDSDDGSISQKSKIDRGILTLGIAPKTMLILDTQCFITEERFRGVKNVPTGLHFISTRSTHPAVPSAPVSFFFHSSASKGMQMYHWDYGHERLREVSAEDQRERIQYAHEHGQFNLGLASYNQAQKKEWKALSEWIDRGTIEQIMNGVSAICVAEEARSLDDLSPHVPSEAALLRQLQSGAEKTELSPERLNYTPFPIRIETSGCSAAELSAMNLDKTRAFMEMLRVQYGNDWKRLLGEFQFCFIAFAFGQSLRGLEQWKRMCHYMLGCFDGGSAKVNVFRHLLKALRHQLEFSLRGEFQDVDETIRLLSGSFLKHDLVEYLRVGLTEGSGFRAATRKICEALSRFVREKLQWDITCEDEEYAPVVVDLENASA